MSVFLTPDLEPFWGGTYLPLDSFMQLCTEVERVYREKREDLFAQAEQIAAQINKQPQGGRGEMSAALVAETAEAGMSAYDPGWGGFRQSQKFPTPLRWRFLMHHARLTGDDDVFKAVRHTLNAMASGGIHDHLGGAFHRYTTEQTWLVPHFEIMLYDNAQLADLYLEAGRVFDHEPYVETGLGVLDFLLRAMRDPDGGIYASFDADSGGHEGSFYVWTPEEITAVAGPEDGPVLAHLLGVEAGGNFEGKSILTRRVPVADAARAFDRDEDEVAALLPRWREALYAARAERVWPGLDRKVVTAWNGLTISALARGYAVSGDVRYRDAAVAAADYLWSVHRDDRGRLARASTEGVVSGEGILDDYAFLAHGLLDLYQADGDVQHLERARTLVDTARTLFGTSEGDYFLTPEDVEAPLGRRLEVFDSVEPSGGAVLVQAMIRLGSVSGDRDLLAAADQALSVRAGLLERAGLEMAWWADAALWRRSVFYDVVIAGDARDAATEALVEAFHDLAPAHAVLTRIPAAGADARQLEVAPSLQGKQAVDGAAAAYVCVEGACKEPVRDPAALRRQLLDGWKR